MDDLGLVALSLHQRTAPLDARERFLDFAERPGADRVLLATCRRVELYARPADEDARGWASRELGLQSRDPLYRSIDDLADEAAELPAAELVAIGERCAAEADRFVREWSERAAVETIRDVRGKAEAVRHAQLARALFGVPRRPRP